MRKIRMILVGAVALLSMQACDINVTTIVDDNDGNQPSDTTSNGGGTVPVTGVRITPVLTTIFIGAGCAVPAVTQFEAWVLPDTANQGLTWSINKSSVASIDQNGKATGLSVGVTMVTARSVQDSTKVANATLTVSDQDCATAKADSTIVIVPLTTSLGVGATTQLGTICRINSIVVSCDPWFQSLDTNVLSVGPHSGIVTANGVGSTLVIAQWSEAKTSPADTVSITVSGG